MERHLATSQRLPGPAGASVLSGHDRHSGIRRLAASSDTLVAGWPTCSPTSGRARSWWQTCTSSSALPMIRAPSWPPFPWPVLT